MRILFTGSRKTKDATRLRAAFSDYLSGPALLTEGKDIVFVHGGAPGLDSLVDHFAANSGWNCERHPADWGAHGNAAGPLRNEHMVSLGADVCLAFPGPDSVGTWDCIRKAARAGIPVRIYPVED